MPDIIMDYRKKSRETSVHDLRNYQELKKIGKEINRFKRLDGVKPAEIEKRFGRDANKLLERKPDRSLAKDIARDVYKGIKYGI